MFNGAFDYLCWIFNFHLNVRETQIALKYVSVCKLWISCKLFLPFVHNVRYKNINLIETPEHKKKPKFHKNSWEEPGYWPFYSTKTLYSTTKIKKFSMQWGLSPPCNPPPQKPSSKVSRAVCKFCHFLKICHFCFYPALPQKTWEEPWSNIDYYFNM